MKKAGRILPMNKPQKESQRLASWLADAIMTEMAKPEEEIDVEFVESCENLLNTIMGEKKLSDEEIEVRVNKIMEKRSKPRSVPKKRKTAFIAIIAAVVFLLSGITVCATTPISQYILKTLDLGLNQSKSEGEITFINNGERTSYKSIEDFLDSENLRICYPEIFPYNTKVEEILRYENDQTFFVFNDPRISFKIQHNNSELPQDEDAELLELNNIIFYLFSSDYSNKISAYALIGNDFYVLSCDSKELLIEMIHSFNFERLE